MQAARPAVPAEIEFVIALEGRPQLVVATEVDVAWTSGAPAFVVGEPVVTARKAISPSALPMHLSSRVGQTVSLMGTHGAMCEATVTSLSAVTRLAPDGPTAERDDLSPTHLWESDIADHLLVADLSPLRGDCTGALYAKATGDARTWTSPSAPTGPQEDVARRAFRALPPYQTLHQDDDVETTALVPTVRTFDVGGSRYYFVSEGDESSCGIEHLAALFRADRAETPRELELVSTSTELAGDVVGLIHDPRSSEVHVLYSDYEVRIRQGHEPDGRRTVRVPFEGCGC